jgi:pyruvate,water dikinase
MGAVQSKPAAEFLEEVRSSPSMSQFRERFGLFLKEYGHRSHTREMYFPRWADDPALVVDILRSLSAASDIDVERMERETVAKRLEAEKEIGRRISHARFGFFKKRIFNIVLKFAQTYLIFRENQRFYLDHIISRQRRIFMEYGRRLAERGMIGRQDDIFFLSKEEVFALAKGELSCMGAEIASRRVEFEKYRDVLPPKFLKGRAEFDDTVVLKGNVLKVTGTSASPGIATGPVRIVESIDEISTVRSGEILVTSNTDPGWTPVFSQLAGLITETGGILSHGAVVSREYGIPAVTAVKGAKQIFKTGQRVTVDGNDGVIYLLEE